MGTTRVLRSLLFETEPLDPATLLAAAAVLVAAAFVATYRPARRATKVDPMAVLRSEWSRGIGRRLRQPPAPYTKGIWRRVRNTCVYPGFSAFLADLEVVEIL